MKFWECAATSGSSDKMSEFRVFETLENARYRLERLQALAGSEGLLLGHGPDWMMAKGFEGPYRVTVEERVFSPHIRHEGERA